MDILSRVWTTDAGCWPERGVDSCECIYCTYFLLLVVLLKILGHKIGGPSAAFVQCYGGGGWGWGWGWRGLLLWERCGRYHMIPGFLVYYDTYDIIGCIFVGGLPLVFVVPRNITHPTTLTV